MKKYTNFILIIFILVIGSINFVFAKDNNLKGKVIVLDPGHGNKDPGTVFGDIYEKEINLNIALTLKKVLEKSGAKVIMTRDGDYDLAYPGAMYRKKSDFDNRIKLINSSSADLYLSIHLNFLSDSSYYGPQVFYDKDNVDLASLMQKYLNKETNTSRKIKKIPKETYMYDKLKVHGVLIECGFLSNRSEREKLTDSKYQKKLAQGIKKALEKYFTN